MSRKRVLLILCAAVAAVSVVFWLKPWARRFEGRTAKEWIGEFAAKNQVDQRVIEAFGADAAPALEAVIEREIRTGKLRHVTSEILEMVVRRDVDLENTESHQRAIAAGTWLSWMKAKGYHPKMNFSPAMDRWLDCWDDTFWAPRWVQLILTTPDQSKAAKEEEAAAENKRHQALSVGAAGIMSRPPSTFRSIGSHD